MRSDAVAVEVAVRVRVRGRGLIEAAAQKRQSGDWRSQEWQGLRLVRSLRSAVAQTLEWQGFQGRPVGVRWLVARLGLVRRGCGPPRWDFAGW